MNNPVIVSDELLKQTIKILEDVRTCYVNSGGRENERDAKIIGKVILKLEDRRVRAPCNSKKKK